MKRASVYDWKAAEFAADERIRREMPARIVSDFIGGPLLLAAAAALVILCAAI